MTTLASHGFVAAEDEALDLLLAAENETTARTMLERRLHGEPLAWITGRCHFAGLEVLVDPGVYVPRWQSEEMVARAVPLLPSRGFALDLCTGSGALALALTRACPSAHIVGIDLDERAVRCAARNGVVARRGDLYAPIPDQWRGHVDLVCAVAPYVPTPELRFLARDTLDFETTLAYDGGVDGLDLVRRIIDEGRHVLRAGGHLVLELGGDQRDPVEDALTRAGYGEIDFWEDEDGDLRGVVATSAPRGRDSSPG